MFCNQCGTQLKQGVRFCVNCGSKVDDGPQSQAPKTVTPDTGASSSTEGNSFRTQTSHPKAMSGAQPERGHTSLDDRHSGTVALGKSQPTSRSMSPVVLWGGIAFLVIAVLLTAFLLYHRSPSGSPASDAEIEKALQANFAADPNLGKCTLEVRSQSGVVTLSGLVNSDTDKSVATRIAEQQDGVKQVNVYGLVKSPVTNEGAGSGESSEQGVGGLPNAPNTGVVSQAAPGCSGRPPSGHLGLSITSQDSTTGLVNVNGVDNRQPTRAAFTWTWGDGTTTQGWFPQSHVYANTRQNYVLQVISHEDDGSTDCAQILVRLSGPTLSATPPVPEIAEESGPSPMPSGSPASLGGKTRSPQSRAIRDVDFLNFDYSSDCWKGWDSKEPTKVVHVSNGEWSKEGFGSFSVDQRASRWLISYGDLKSDGQEEAVVVTSCLGEIPSAELALTAPEEVLVFAMSSTGPVVLARLRAGGWIGGGRYQQEGQVYDIRVTNQRLVVRSLTYGPDAPHCCPDILISATYRWDGKRLVHTGEDRREPFKSP
jgi:hypothetical protein